ncbi:MAG: FeS assembly SUF system regulator [Lysobacterales bacterium]|jgi:FeS assembly SUF system regulator
MLRISKLTDYAILVMVELNECHGEVLNAHAVADNTHLELPTVSKILKLLAKAGLVQSFRGINGGYAMDRSAGSINVAQIIAAIEGPIAMTECSVEVGLCSQEQVCSMRSNWRRISSAVARAMEGVTLAEMSRPIHNLAPSLNIATLNS